MQERSEHTIENAQNARQNEANAVAEFRVRPVFTRVIGDVVQYGPGCLCGGLAQFDAGPDLQKQVDTDQQSVPNVEQTCRVNSERKLKTGRSTVKSCLYARDTHIWSSSDLLTVSYTKQQKVC